MYQSEEFPSNECGMDHRGLDPAPLRRVSAHRPPPLYLPPDPRDAAAQALAHIRGDDSYNRAAALEAMTGRVVALRDGDSDEALECLASHLPVLEALWLKFGVEAALAKSSEHKAKLLRMSLSAQSSYLRTQIALAGLRQQRAGRATVTVIDDEAES